MKSSGSTSVETVIGLDIDDDEDVTENSSRTSTVSSRDGGVPLTEERWYERGQFKVGGCLNDGCLHRRDHHHDEEQHGTRG